MNKTLAYVSLIIVYAIISIGLPSSSMAQPKNIVSLGGLVNPIGSVVGIQYEREISPFLSIGGFIGQLEYDVEYDEDGGTTTEEGDGMGFQVLVFFHLGDRGMDGFYFGPGIGMWNTDWEWRWEHDTYNDETGDGSSTVIDLNFRLGYKFNLASDKFVIDPNLQVGNYSSDSDGGDELGAYIGVGVLFGYAW